MDVSHRKQHVSDFFAGVLTFCLRWNNYNIKLPVVFFFLSENVQWQCCVASPGGSRGQPCAQAQLYCLYVFLSVLSATLLFFFLLFGDFTRSVSSVSTVTEEQTRVILTSFNCIFLACRCKPIQQARESPLSLPWKDWPRGNCQTTGVRRGSKGKPDSPVGKEVPPCCRSSHCW